MLGWSILDLWPRLEYESRWEYFARAILVTQPLVYGMLTLSFFIPLGIFYLLSQRLPQPSMDTRYIQLYDAAQTGAVYYMLCGSPVVIFGVLYRLLHEMRLREDILWSDQHRETIFATLQADIGLPILVVGVPWALYTLVASTASRYPALQWVLSVELRSWTDGE